MFSSLAGISVFILDDSFDTFAIFVSPHDGTLMNHTLSTRSPSTSSLSTELALQSTFKTIDKCKLKDCKPALLSLPFGIPSLQRSAILDAFTSSSIPIQDNTITHGQAYCASIPLASGFPLILFLHYTPTQISLELLECEISDGMRGTQEIREKVLSTAEARQEATLREWVDLGPLDTPMDQIVLLNQFPEDLGDTLENVLAAIHPNTPIHVASQDEIAKGVALREYTYNDKTLRMRQTGQHIIPMPISIATTNGDAITLFPTSFKLPTRHSAILTTSVNNQTSVTVQLLLGNHPKADDNLARNALVLDGLIPLPKGTTRIQVSGRVFMRNDEAAAEIAIEQLLDDEVTVEKLLGNETHSNPLPRKVFGLDGLFKGLDEDVVDRYVLRRPNLALWHKTSPQKSSQEPQEVDLHELPV